MMIKFSLARGRIFYPWYRSTISGGEIESSQNWHCGCEVTNKSLFRFVLLADEISFIGVILVSSSDSPSKPPVPLDPNALVMGGNISGVTLGNFLALFSALFYAMYIILLKVRIKAEYRIDMQLFFGFVGLFNIIGCWPVGLILHLVGTEIFELPHTKQAVYAILINVRVYCIGFF